MKRRRHTIVSLNDVLPLAARFDVVSFDLFDTLLRRRTLTFEEIHQLSTGRLMRWLDPAVFDSAETVSLHRHHTADILRDSAAVGSREPPLDAILERLLASRNASPDEDRRRIAEEASAFELELERESLEAHSDAERVLSGLKKAGKRVIALSDMYFSPAQMDELLQAKGLRHLFDAVFVSTGIGETKHEGRAFGIVEEELGIAADRILHVGDNPVSDVDNAVAAGWTAALISSHFPQLSPHAALDGEELLVDLAGDMMAAFLIAVLLRAQRSGSRRVFFLSRDATVMLRIWDRVRKANPALEAEFAGIEIRELCVSRSATQVLSTAWSKDFAVDAAGRVGWLAGRPVSYREVADYYGIPLPAATEGPDRSLPSKALGAALEHDGLTESLRGVIVERRELALDYLLQQGAVGDGPAIFADIGYSGTIAVYIANFLLRERPDLLARTDIDVMMVASNGYLAQNRTLARQAARIHPGVLFSHEQLPAILSDNFAWLECLFRDTLRGPLRGYCRRGEAILPMFDPAAGESDGLRTRFEDAAVRKLSGGLSALGYGTPARIAEIRKTAIAAFMHPSPALVEAAASLTQEADSLGLSAHPLVEKVSRAAAPMRLRHWKIADYWISGCLVASGQRHLIGRYGMIKTGNRLLRQAAALPRRIAQRVLR